jgi:hypothetical protein
MGNDEFYIGYETDVPAGVTARLRGVVPSIAALALAVAVGLLVFHERLQPSRFEFGRPHAADGVLHRSPYPMLSDGGRTILLVGPGKHGAGAVLGSTPDGPVRLQGATITRGGVEMLEVVPGSVEARGAATTDSTADAIATAVAGTGEVVTLTGEIVDSKCHLGVMNPGEGTVHRDCARLCLRGDIPPMLLTRGRDGQESLVLLVSAEGGAVGTALAGMAGRAVSVRGRLGQHGRRRTLFADARSFVLAASR